MQKKQFIQLLKLRGLDDPRIDSWLSKKTSKYTSHVIQNEILKAMYLNVIRNVASKFENQDSFVLCVMNVVMCQTRSS